MMTTTISKTKTFLPLSAASPEFIPIREYNILSARSSNFITTKAYKDNTPTVTATHPSSSSKTSIKTSISSKNIAFLLEKLGKIPELTPTYSNRPPLPTPDESLTKWQIMDYSNSADLLSPSFNVNTTNRNLTSNTAPSSTSASTSPPPAKTSNQNSPPSPSSSSPPSSTTSNVNESTKNTAPTEEDPEAFRARIQAANELQWAQANAEHAARQAERAAQQAKRWRDASIVVGEQEITEMEIWLWEHPILGIYRCSEPSPLRCWMAYA